MAEGLNVRKVTLVIANDWQMLQRLCNSQILYYKNTGYNNRYFLFVLLYWCWTVCWISTDIWEDGYLTRVGGIFYGVSISLPKITKHFSWFFQILTQSLICPVVSHHALSYHISSWPMAMSAWGWCRNIDWRNEINVFARTWPGHRER